MLSLEQVQHSKGFAVTGGLGCAREVGGCTTVCLRSFVPVDIVGLLGCFPSMRMCLWMQC